MSTYNTNLASEFYVLSVLYRMGADASLTLGNKKSVDIVVVRELGDVATIDVKGVAGSYDWPADNIRAQRHPANHFLVFVSYEGNFSDPETLPNCWIVPYPEVAQFFRQYKGRKNVSRSDMLKKGQQYKNAWHLIIDTNRLEESGIT